MTNMSTDDNTLVEQEGLVGGEIGESSQPEVSFVRTSLNMVVENLSPVASRASAVMEEARVVFVREILPIARQAFEEWQEGLLVEWKTYQNKGHGALELVLTVLIVFAVAFHVELIRLGRSWFQRGGLLDHYKLQYALWQQQRKCRQNHRKRLLSSGSTSTSTRGRTIISKLTHNSNFNMKNIASPTSTASTAEAKSSITRPISPAPKNRSSTLLMMQRQHLPLSPRGSSASPKPNARKLSPRPEFPYLQGTNNINNINNNSNSQFNASLASMTNPSSLRSSNSLGNNNSNSNSNSNNHFPQSMILGQTVNKPNLLQESTGSLDFTPKNSRSTAMTTPQQMSNSTLASQQSHSHSHTATQTSLYSASTTASSVVAPATMSRQASSMSDSAGGAGGYRTATSGEMTPNSPSSSNTSNNNQNNVKKVVDTTRVKDISRRIKDRRRVSAHSGGSGSGNNNNTTTQTNNSNGPGLRRHHTVDTIPHRNHSSDHHHSNNITPTRPRGTKKVTASGNANLASTRRRLSATHTLTPTTPGSSNHSSTAASAANNNAVGLPGPPLMARTSSGASHGHYRRATSGTGATTSCPGSPLRQQARTRSGTGAMPSTRQVHPRSRSGTGANASGLTASQMYMARSQRSAGSSSSPMPHHTQQSPSARTKSKSKKQQQYQNRERQSSPIPPSTPPNPPSTSYLARPQMTRVLSRQELGYE